MTPLLIAFDAVLCMALLLLTWRVVVSTNLFHGVVMFMILGLLMALTWARLGAPDLALAEAAIGAGITGALLLNACRGIVGDSARAGTLTHPHTQTRRTRAALFTLCLTVGGLLAWVLVGALPAPAGTASAAARALDTHPLGNPVTAVLLDFRGHDTLLEMAVLLLAFLGLGLLIAQQPLSDLNPSAPVTAPMLEPLLAIATPVLGVMALYLFQAGGDGPGGAFQAGALLGALGVLHRLTGRLHSVSETPPGVRMLLSVGLGGFVVFAVAALGWSDAPLSYPETLAYPLLLGIEFLLMISIATTLVLLFSAAPGVRSTRR